MRSIHHLKFFLTSAVVLALTLILAVSSAISALPSQAGSTSTAAIVFGVGSPAINAERSGTSIGVMAGGTLYVFDAGPGVERRIMESTSKLAERNVRRLGPVFISHLHADHTVGLAALLTHHSMGPGSLLGLGGADLPIYGPPAAKGALGIREVMDHLRAAFFSTVTADGIRAEELTGQDGPQFHTIDLRAGVVFGDANVTVTALPVSHKTPVAFGFRIQTADRVIVISGDTRPVEAVIQACNGCDLLFHEVYGLEYGPNGPTGNAQGHTSAAELGELARQARPKRLVIYHDARAPQKEALEAIRKSFSGEVTFARDLDIF